MNGIDMKTRRYAAAIIALLAAAIAAPAADSTATPPGIPVKGYKLVWADEFDGTTLDRTKWVYRQLGPRRDAVNVKDTVSLDGKGTLVLTTRKEGDKYHTAMIATQGKFETTYGYFECRARLQTQLGHWSAFWLQSPTMGKEVGNPAESGTEVDIFEYLLKYGEKILHNIHWDGYGKDHQRAGTKVAIPGLGKGFHTFGLLWTAEEYVFYVDGKETWRTNKGISKRSEYIILSLEVGKWAGDIAKVNLPDDFLVDYVRVYKRDAGSLTQ
jgi:beta-glucanase (GH16 family)